MRHDIHAGFDRQQSPREALAMWDADPATLEPVRESMNFVYRFRDPQGRERYLRIGTQAKRSLSAIQAELDFVAHLHAQGAPVAPPVASRAGNLVEPLETSVGPMHVTVFEAVHGQIVKWGTDAQNRKYLLERGQALGRLHRAAMSFTPVPGRRRFHWYEDDLFSHPQKFLPPSEKDARREYEELLQWMVRRPRTKENYGMVHGDFGTFNMLRRPDGTMVALDFDDCCFHWYLYDLAVSIRSARKLPENYLKAYVRVLMDGYQKEMSLNGDTVEDLARFCRLAALYRFVSVKRAIGPAGPTEEQLRMLNERREVVAHPPAWF